MKEIVIINKTQKGPDAINMTIMKIMTPIILTPQQKVFFFNFGYF